MGVGVFSWLLLGGAAVALGAAAAWSLRDLTRERQDTARGWIAEGLRRLDRRDAEGASRAFARAMQRSMAAGDLACTGAAWRGMGLIRAHLGDLPGAEAAFRAAADAARQSRDATGEAAALRALAKLYRDRGRDLEALRIEAHANGLLEQS